MPVLIGLHGKRGSGKDTAFSFIQQWAKGRGVRAGGRGFADTLKWSFARLFTPDCSMSEGISWCNSIKETGSLIVGQELHLPGDQVNRLTQEISGRVALQRYGTEMHRDVFGADFWVDQLLPMTEGFTPDAEQQWPYNFVGEYFNDWEPPEICCITDLRFINEAQRIKDLGGEIWKIDRPVENEDNHASEVELPEEFIDVVCLNWSDLPAFYASVVTLMDLRHSEVANAPD